MDGTGKIHRFFPTRSQDNLFPHHRQLMKFCFAEIVDSNYFLLGNMADLATGRAAPHLLRREQV